MRFKPIFQLILDSYLNSETPEIQEMRRHNPGTVKALYVLGLVLDMVISPLIGYFISQQIVKIIVTTLTLGA